MMVTVGVVDVKVKLVGVVDARVKVRLGDRKVLLRVTMVGDISSGEEGVGERGGEVVVVFVSYPLPPFPLLSSTLSEIE